jgi:hypothetical protein
VHARLLAARGFLYLITQELESSSGSGSGGGGGGFDANEAGPSQVLGLLPPAVALPGGGWFCMALAGLLALHKGSRLWSISVLFCRHACCLA